MEDPNETKIFDFGVMKNDEMSSRCKHLLRIGRRKGQTCDAKVTKLDPEGRYCAEHQICTFIIVEEKVKPAVKEAEKYVNYDTFEASRISNPEEIKKVRALWSK